MERRGEGIRMAPFSLLFLLPILFTILELSSEVRRKERERERDGIDIGDPSSGVEGIF